MKRHGVVYLVGAGPGDPGLITVRGARLLRRADVIVYDRLIGRELLLDTIPGVETIDVGKKPGAPCIRQDDINTLLIDRARAGFDVVRLKGGDPFVFGRGFEELTACRKAGVPCVVIPGVSSAFAAPSAAGIPVTSRRRVRSVAIITGSFTSDHEVPDVDYTALATMDTIVILMGRARLAHITQSLIEGGKSPRNRITYAFRLAASRRPTSPELKILVEGFEHYLSEYRRDQQAAKKLISAGESPLKQELDAAELAAYTAVGSLILNLDEVLTKE